MATELQSLKMKKRMSKATPEDLTRLKLLQDGEPLSAADLENAREREEERKATDKVDYAARQKGKQPKTITLDDQAESMKMMARLGSEDKTLDIPSEHPRIAQIKEALLPFTKIEAHDSRPDEFTLFTRGISITAGDVRNARKAMKL